MRPNNAKAQIPTHLGSASCAAVAGKWKQARSCRPLDQPQFQTGPIGVRVQQGPKLPPL
jgi:hypothetical protein